ncbi:hypothetical protein V8C86DRAFT_2850985 [Haematococcus lacustris]
MDSCSAIVWGATYGLFVRNTTGVPRTPYGQERWSDFQHAVCHVNWGDVANERRSLSPSEMASFHTVASVIITNYNPSTLPTIPSAFLAYPPFLAVRDYTSIVCLDLPVAVLQQYSVDTLAQQSTIFAGASGVVYKTQYTGCLTKLKMRGFEARRLSAIDQEVLTMSLTWITPTPDDSSCQLGTVSILPRTVPVACRLTAPGLQPQTVNSGFNDITFEHGVQYNLSCTPSFPPDRPSVQVNFLITTEVGGALSQTLLTEMFALPQPSPSPSNLSVPPPPSHLPLTPQPHLPLPFPEPTPSPSPPPSPHPPPPPPPTPPPSPPPSPLPSPAAPLGHCSNPARWVIHGPANGMVINSAPTTCSSTDSSACKRGARDYVYEFAPYPATRNITVDTCVDGVEPWDTVLYVFPATNNACSCPRDAVADDDGSHCGLLRSRVFFTADAGVAYFVVVEGLKQPDCGVPAISVDVSAGFGHSLQTKRGG